MFKDEFFTTTSRAMKRYVIIIVIIVTESFSYSLWRKKAWLGIVWVRWVD